MARQDTKGRNFMKPRMVHATCELFLWFKVQFGCSVHQMSVGIICVCWGVMYVNGTLCSPLPTNIVKSGSSIFQTHWTLSAFK